MMTKPTDMMVKDAALYFFSLPLRVPLKFGAETVVEVTLARVRLRVRDSEGRIAEGWGETPLNVGWVWPSKIQHSIRDAALRAFCIHLAEAWRNFDSRGHALEIGWDFQKAALPSLLGIFNKGLSEPLPVLAALVCCSAFDIALHDAYGVLHGRSTFETYNARYMSRDLGTMLQPATGSNVSFIAKYPQDFLTSRQNRLPVWHLVGGKDPLHEGELTGLEPDDGYPVMLRDWIRTDKLRCLKIKLRGCDSEWDYNRLVEVGKISIEEDVHWLSADFNCQVLEPDYVNEILDRLMTEHPRIYGMTLYIEQPFPYELEEHCIDVRSVSARKPLFMDESAHDWEHVRIGRDLGWTGVALKTCKTQTGALLSLCWAKAHGMTLMVQDLTNPMLAQVTHALLASHAGTIMGVECNAMQFYPSASAPEEAVHPGLFKRRQGIIDLSTVRGAGFGYRLDEISRILPAAAYGE